MLVFTSWSTSFRVPWPAVYVLRFDQNNRVTIVLSEQTVDGLAADGEITEDQPSPNFLGSKIHFWEGDVVRLGLRLKPLPLQNCQAALEDRQLNSTPGVHHHWSPQMVNRHPYHQFQQYTFGPPRRSPGALPHWLDVSMRVFHWLSPAWHGTWGRKQKDESLPLRLQAYCTIAEYVRDLACWRRKKNPETRSLTPLYNLLNPPTIPSIDAPRTAPCQTPSGHHTGSSAC